MSDFKTNRIFRPGSEISLNACVGENGGPYDSLDYAKGYFSAALVIVDSARELRIPTDLAVYPVVFSFRHGIELALKYFVQSLPRAADDTPRLKCTHNLTDNWEVVRASVLGLEPLDPVSTIPTLDGIIRDVVDFDPTGQVFRFPSDRSGNLHLQEARIINLGVLQEEIEASREIFDFWEFQRDRLHQAELEGH